MCAKARPKGGAVCEILRMVSETEEMGARRRMIEWEAKRRPESSTNRRRTRHIGNILLCLRHYYITFAVHRGTPSMCCVAVGKEIFHGCNQTC